MKIYKTQSEVEKDIKNGVLAITGDVKFECSISIEANIDISAGNISAGNISAGDILYYAVAFVYKSIRCKSIRGKRPNSHHFALDGEVVVYGKEVSK